MTHARMLGTAESPPCGKCCGWESKADNQKAKRRQKRRERADLRLDIIKDHV